MKLSILVTILFILALGCSEGFKTFGTEQSEGSSDHGDSGNTPTPVNQSLKAFIQTGPFEGLQVLNDIQNSKLNIIVPIGINSFVPAGPLATVDNQVTGSILSNNVGFKTAYLSVPAQWVLQGVNLPEVTHLPNGDSLPYFPKGRASHLALSLDSQSQSVLYLYFNAPAFGVFIQTPFDQGDSRQYSITYNNTFLEIGRFSTHPHHSPMNGGMFLFISLPQ